MRSRWAPLLLLVAANCGENPTPLEPDADSCPANAQPGPCWPVAGTTPGGSVKLGAYQPFTSMPDEVELEYGPQGGFHIPVNALITGIPPGTPSCLFDPQNPRTRFRGYYVEDVPKPPETPAYHAGEEMNGAISCPIRIAYRESGTPGTFELVGKTGVLFAVGIDEYKYIFGQKIRVEVEVIGANGEYARDEKIVIARPPANWPPPGMR